MAKCIRSCRNGHTARVLAMFVARTHKGNMSRCPTLYWILSFSFLLTLPISIIVDVFFFLFPGLFGRSVRFHPRFPRPECRQECLREGHDGGRTIALVAHRPTEGSYKTDLFRLGAPDVLLPPQASPESLVPPSSEAFNGDNSPPSRVYSAPAWHVSLNTGLTVGRAYATFSKHSPSGS